MDTLLHKVKKATKGINKSWVLFENGSIVFIQESLSKSEMKKDAMNILSTYGKYSSGTSLGDFDIIGLDNQEEWLVTSSHKNLLTYVVKSEVEDNATDVQIGLWGKIKRDKDFKQQKIIHIER